MPYIILDGSMGAMLLREGVSLGAVPEDANLTDAAVVQKLHAAYAAAGADIVETLSLGANPLTLAEKGRSEDLQALVRAAVRNAKEAVADRAKVALSAGPTGEMIAPLGDVTPRQVYEAYLAQMTIGREAEADLAIAETHNDLAEARLCALAAKKAGLPVILSLTMDSGACTMMGNSPEAAAAVAEALGAEAVGVNCVGELAVLEEVVRRMHAATSLPILVMPNAGLPQFVDGRNSYSLSPDDYEAWMLRLMDGGATYLGGCCGTGPEHIERLRPLLEGREAPEAEDKPVLLATARNAVPLTEALEQPFSYTLAAGADPEDVAEDLMDAEDEEATCLLIALDEADEATVEEVCLQVLSSARLPIVFASEQEDLLSCALLNTPGVCGARTTLTEIARAWGAVLC